MSRFLKTKEDFVCEQCGKNVEGTGYTNHCPRCLWSKHVDVHPGDRAASCGGAMEPVCVSVSGGLPTILHRCRTCGFSRRQSADSQDSADTLAELSATPPLCPRKAR